eukprot:Skav201527  [mRNA]  locus=scaffold3018:45705:47239:+ [translate_table: standard]
MDAASNGHRLPLIASHPAAGAEIVRAKCGKGSATLSLGYAGYLLGSAVLNGLAGNRTTARVQRHRTAVLRVAGDFRSSRRRSSPEAMVVASTVGPWCDPRADDLGILGARSQVKGPDDGERP